MLKSRKSNAGARAEIELPLYSKYVRGLEEDGTHGCRLVVRNLRVASLSLNSSFRAFPNLM